MAGTLRFDTKLQGAEITVAGSMSGTMTMREMYFSTVALNTPNNPNTTTSGTINIGQKSTNWVPTSQNLVEFGMLHCLGVPEPSARFNFYGCPTNGAELFGTLCFDGNVVGLVQKYFRCDRNQAIFTEIDYCSPDE